jgi:hypothetical protein
VSYLEFLIQWYNWPYVAALFAATLAWWLAPATEAWGRWYAHRLRIETVSGRSVYVTFWIVVALVGLTLNGAVHDYAPAWLARAFAPVLIVTLVIAALLTRWIVRTRDRYFPPIRAVRFNATDLAGAAGRVVSREVGPDVPAGRVQVVTREGVLHIVRGKTRGERLRFGRRVILLEHDASDGRYFVVSEKGEVSRS